MEIIEEILANAEVKLKGFKKRNAQLKMIEDVKSAFENENFLAIEAPTGTGKSLAYLISAVDFIKKTNEKVIISTASINLQEQLIKKDIKDLEKIMPFKLKFAVIKGMRNYLCKRLLNELLENFALYEFSKENLEKLVSWSKITKTGDKDELKFIDSKLWEEVSASIETCSRATCPNENICFFKKAKRQALEADIIVTNHHLLFTDLYIRNEINKQKELNNDDEDEDVVEENDEYNLILPSVKNVIIDEAHYIEEAARTIFTERVSKIGIKRLFFKINKIILKSKIENFSLEESMIRVLLVFEKIETLIKERDSFEPVYRITSNSYNTKFYKEIVTNLEELINNLENYKIASLTLLKKIEDKVKRFEFSRLIQNIEERKKLISIFTSKNSNENLALWIETTKTTSTFNTSEIDLGVGLSTIMHNRMKRAIFTSATICINKDFSYFFKQIGLDLIEKNIRKEILPSSFYYNEQAILEVVKDIKEPNNEEEFYPKSLDYIKELILINKGGTLILLTSLKSLENVGNALLEFGKENNIKIFIQGQLPKNELINSFKECKSKSVLIGIKNFWEGIDIKGEKLTMVIIPRLPFQTPSDPISIAKNEIALRKGKNTFMIETLPQAITKFKQGFGRLIRDETDYGVVVCLDTRIFQKHYGKYFINSLPEVKANYLNFEDVKIDIVNFFK